MVTVVYGILSHSVNVGVNKIKLKVAHKIGFFYWLFETVGG